MDVVSGKCINDVAHSIRNILFWSEKDMGLPFYFQDFPKNLYNTIILLGISTDPIKR
jgi:hypothetical protein